MTTRRSAKLLPLSAKPLPLSAKLLFLLAALAAGPLLAAAPVSAQQAAPPPQTAPPALTETAPLVIPPPPGGKLRVEMDARSEDLLGMVKSFLKGIGETGPPVTTTAAGRALSLPNPVAEAIASGDLAAMLRDVNHVHLAVYEVAGAAGPSPVIMVTPVQPGLKKSFAAAPSAAPPVPPAPAAPAFDSNSFYESAFAAEGAHRILYTDADAYKLVMVGFPNRRGFAFAASGGGYVVVERSDGYPDLEVLTAFISHVTTAVVNSQMGKKMMNSTLDGSKLALPAELESRKDFHPKP